MSKRTITPRTRRLLTLLLVVLVTVFVVLALHNSWHDVKRSLRSYTTVDLLGGFAAAVASTWALFFAWRAILHGLHADTLSAHDSRVMFFCSQLGKYVPGSVWTAVIQGEIGARSKVSRAVVMSSYALALIVGVGIGGITTAGAISGDSPWWVRIASIGGIVGGIALCTFFAHPGGSQSWGRRWIERRRPDIELGVIDGRAAARTIAWTTAEWLLLGVHAWFLARPFGVGASDFWFVLGGYALAWTVGLIAIPLPAGAGLREAVIVATLGHRIGNAEAISLALVSRLLIVINDVVLSLVMGLPRVLREAKARRPLSQS